jgi:predicted acylesterase/phospholipase RssA
VSDATTMQASAPNSDERDAAAAPRDIAVALSGGGHRATLFALGVLLYLVDTGMNRRVGTISSVSGGSIANGFVAQECDFATTTPDEFDRVAAALLDRVVRHGLFHRSWQVWAYLLLIVLGVMLAASATFAGWPVEWPPWLGALVAVCLAALVLLRGMVINLQLARRVLSRDGRSTKLVDVPRSVEHVFCATDITSGAPFYFSTAEGGYVYSPALGKSHVARTRLAGLTLATAVRASAAFPGGIPPKRLVLGDVKYDFRLDGDVAEWQTEHTRYREVGRYRPRLLFLADGGVWNNLGTQALLEHRPGRGQWDHKASGLDPRWSQLIVVNASAPMRAAAGAWRLHVPLYADFATLMRSIDTLNSNTVDPRIAALRQRRGCTVVSIADVRDRAFPYADVSAFKHLYPDDADLQRLNDDQRMESWSELRLLDTLGHESLAWHCSALPTTLGRLSRADALRLVIHGYQNALGEFFALGGPRPRPSPPQSRFTRLIPRRGRESDSLSVQGKVYLS